MVYILVLFVFAIFFLFLPPAERSWQPGANLRKRTDEQYQTIMDATNWDPDAFYEGEDGVYRNSRGEVGVVYTLEELQKIRAEKK